jgi:ribonuclease HI
MKNINYDSISVDVGCRGGNPGLIEYRGVDTYTGETIFQREPIGHGTNNLGEFLAIVHGLAFLKKQRSNRALYSDSLNAIRWVEEKRVTSNLRRNADTAKIWSLVDTALLWLETNTYNTEVLYWETELWGEIKADYGRKGKKKRGSSTKHGEALGDADSPGNELYGAPATEVSGPSEG